MTAPQARTWHIARLEDLRRLIDRARTLDDLGKIERSAGHELDAGLRAHLARQAGEMKRVRA